MPHNLERLTEKNRYNSYVLCLLEGFGRLSCELQNKNEELSELKALREKELEQFRDLSEEWIQREKDYKAEIKRLELFLAKESKGGVASVALARHDSIVNRSEAKQFQARVKRASNSHEHGKRCVIEGQKLKEIVALTPLKLGLGILLYRRKDSS